MTIDSGFGWWQEFGHRVVGIDADLPGGVVDDAVMVATQEHEVVEFRLAAVCPVSDVVGVAHHRGSSAAGERAVLVAQDQGDPDRGGDESLGAADVEDAAVGTQDAGDHVGVAGHPWTVAG